MKTLSEKTKELIKEEIEEFVNNTVNTKSVFDIKNKIEEIVKENETLIHYVVTADFIENDRLIDISVYSQFDKNEPYIMTNFVAGKPIEIIEK